MYEEYNKLFFDQVLDNIGVKAVFEDFRDTGIFERYMTNTAQFSASKEEAKVKLMQKEVFDGNRLRSFKEFDEAASQIAKTVDQTWLRTEYDTCRKNAIAGSKFAGMQADADLYPYWIYKGRMDGRERPDHVAMENKVFRIGDPAGDSCFPPNDWNCRCVGDPVDGMYLEEKGLRYQTNAESKKILVRDVDENFRYNAAIQGPLPNNGSYSQVFKSANSGDAATFGMGNLGNEGKELTGLDAAISMRYLMEVVEEWRRKYYVDKKHNIVFQNNATYANVRLNDSTISKIVKHGRGMQNLPDTIMHPDEIWTGWEDEDTQRVVLRAYLKIGRICYIVKTRDGRVTDAFALSRGHANKYRTGVIVG